MNLLSIRTAQFVAAAGLCLLISACGENSQSDSTADTSSASHSLGLIEITISGLGTGQMISKAVMLPSSSGERAKVAMPTTLPSTGLDMQQASVSTVDVGTAGAGGERYFSVVYNVRNAQSCKTPGTCAAYAMPRQNLTLIAANTVSNINNTALTAIKLFDGSSNATTQALAVDLLPTHGMEFNAANAAGVMVHPGLESLQVFTEAEINSTSIPMPDPDATYLFPYGYVVSNVHTPNSRLLPGSPLDNQWDGEVAFSFKLPLQSNPALDPYSITLIFQVIDDANTRVTESLEEQNPLGDIATTLRATTLGSTDLAVLGGRVAETNNGDPICNVRIAGPSSAPTAYLANNAGVTVGSAPDNVQGLSPTAAINLGFCTTMKTTGLASNFTKVLISGSQSGLRTAAANAPYTGSYSFNLAKNILSFKPTQAFFPGETVSYTLIEDTPTIPGVLSSGNVGLSQAFTGSYMVGTTFHPATSSGTFVEGSTSTGGNELPHGSATADFNRDGKLDIVTGAQTESSVAVALGNGDGSFQTATLVTAGLSPYAVAVGDFNGDGNPDIVTVADVSNQVVILLGNGDGSFQPAVPYPVGNFPDSVAVGDFNGDGKLDLAVANENTASNSVSILLGNGDGTFKPQTVILGIASPNAIVVGDFNGDGNADLAVTNGGGAGSTVSILLGKGDGTFQPPVAYTVGATPGAIAEGDFNGDGKLDLVAANAAGPPAPANSLSVLLGNGDGTFQPQTIYAVGNKPSAVVIGDFNGDGKPDVAASSSTAPNYYSVLLGNGDGTLQPQVVYENNSMISSAGVAAGDFNGDGKLDLAAILNAGKILMLVGQP